MRRGAIFDLDGTLADTSADLLIAANGALAEGGLPTLLDPARDQPLSGRGGRAMLREGLLRAGRAGAEAEIDPLHLRFLEIYEQGIAERTRPFEGVAECLDALAADGWLLGVCTNKPERLADLLLRRLDLRRRFAALVGADTLPQRKPRPEPLWETADRMGADRGRVVLIGDTVTDHRTALAAGAPCVLLDFGLTEDGPARLRPGSVVSAYRDLPAMLARIAGEFA